MIQGKRLKFSFQGSRAILSISPALLDHPNTTRTPPFASQQYAHAHSHRHAVVTHPPRPFQANTDLDAFPPSVNGTPCLLSCENLHLRQRQLLYPGRRRKRLGSGTLRLRRWKPQRLECHWRPLKLERMSLRLAPSIIIPTACLWIRESKILIVRLYRFNRKMHERGGGIPARKSTEKHRVQGRIGGDPEHWKSLATAD